MANYPSQKVLLKNNQEVILRHLEPSDVEKYVRFSELIANETTYTLHYKGQILPIDVLREKWNNSINSQINAQNTNTHVKMT